MIKGESMLKIFDLSTDNLTTLKCYIFMRTTPNVDSWFQSYVQFISTLTLTL